jgi:hypothetical protein
LSAFALLPVVAFVRLLATAVLTLLPQTPLITLLLVGTATGVIIAVVAILLLDRPAAELVAEWNYVSSSPSSAFCT